MANNDDEHVFSRPVLRGRRFDDHGLPTESLNELEKYRKLILKIAAFLFEKKFKQRPPRDFFKAFQLKLIDIEHNCATPVLQLSRVDVADFGLFLNTYQRGRAVLESTVSEVRGGRVPEDFPIELLKELDEFGAGFEKGDSFEFRGPDPKRSGPVYDRETRKAVKQLRQRPPYVKYAMFDGAVTSFNEATDGARTFNLRLANGNALRCRPAGVAEAKVIAALKARRVVRVHVEGQTKFMGDGQPDEVQQIIEFEVWTRSDKTAVDKIDERIRELEALEEGWLNGDGEALNVRDLRWFREHIVRVMAERGLPKPLLYAMPDAGVQAVWRQPPWRIEAEFNLYERRVEVIAVNADADEDDDAEFNLKLPSGWTEFAEFIERWVPTSPPRKLTIEEIP